MIINRPTYCLLSSGKCVRACMRACVCALARVCVCWPQYVCVSVCVCASASVHPYVCDCVRECVYLVSTISQNPFVFVFFVVF